VFKIIKHDQNSDDWLKWRRTGVGASDLSIIMAKSAYKTIDELWSDKVNPPKPQTTNYAIQNGQLLEGVVRDVFEHDMGYKFHPIVIESTKEPWMKASLDGYNQYLNAILEIKVINKYDHQSALNGTIPEQYYPQVQWQLLVSGATKAFYRSYNEKLNDYADVVISPNRVYQRRLYRRARWFWYHVENKIPLPTIKLKLFQPL